MSTLTLEQFRFRPKREIASRNLCKPLAHTALQNSSELGELPRFQSLRDAPSCEARWHFSNNQRWTAKAHKRRKRQPDEKRRLGRKYEHMKATTKKPKKQVTKKLSAKELRAQRDRRGAALIDLYSSLRDIARQLEEIKNGTRFALPAVGVSKIDFLVNAVYHDGLDRIDSHLDDAVASLGAAGKEALNASYLAINPLFQSKANSRNG